MSFNFFTFGGSLFWEDVFFYQKWRIQRHCITKKYRLLDSWDIRRASGTFDACQKAFISNIECYELTKQPKHMIILLHGYMDGKNIFKHLWRKLILTNSTVAAINYPSLFRDSISNAYQLLFFLNHMDDIEEVSFVTKGCGNLVLRQALNLPLELQTYLDNTRIRSIVEINPVINGSLLCDFINKFKIFNFILGPFIVDMTEAKMKNMPDIPNQINSLKIFSKSRKDIFFDNLLKRYNLTTTEKHKKEKNTIYIKGSSFNTLENEEVLNNTVKFINNGKI
ncbi:MAG: hypothetical protein IJZ30_04750 [Alphaproteobacteria bacterium]|nr:hypothetical protein [Alphaproteobacteria bacterium]